MYFYRKGFVRALKISLLDQPFKLRRWSYVLGFSLLYLLFVLAVRLTRRLDGVLWRDIERVPIQEPVFIIAPPRSGTSFLQKLLAGDRGRFIYWKMYQTIFPSVLIDRTVGWVRDLDRCFGRPLARCMDGIQRACFGSWDNLHIMRLDAPEEDGALYLYAFACEAIYMLFPFIEELWELGFPDTLPEEDRKQLMRYYRSCLQRLVYSSGSNNQTLLIKSTNSSGALASILEAFPDARFITLVRDPGDSIASSISLMMPALRAHSPEIAAAGTVSKAYARLSAEWYKYLHEFMGKMPEERVCIVDYRDLVGNPAGTVESIYRHFGWDLSRDYRETLEMVNLRQASYRSEHRYSLEEFGISRAWLYEELSEVMRTNQIPVSGPSVESASA